MLSVSTIPFVLSAIMLNVVMLSIIMLSVMVPRVENVQYASKNDNFFHFCIKLIPTIIKFLEHFILWHFLIKGFLVALMCALATLGTSDRLQGRFWPYPETLD
jgi:hypothetical protein